MDHRGAVLAVTVDIVIHSGTQLVVCIALGGGTAVACHKHRQNIIVQNIDRGRVDTDVRQCHGNAAGTAVIRSTLLILTPVLGVELAGSGLLGNISDRTADYSGTVIIADVGVGFIAADRCRLCLGQYWHQKIYKQRQCQ